MSMSKIGEGPVTQTTSGEKVDAPKSETLSRIDVPLVRDPPLPTGGRVIPVEVRLDERHVETFTVETAPTTHGTPGSGWGDGVVVLPDMTREELRPLVEKDRGDKTVWEPSKQNLKTTFEGLIPTEVAFYDADGGLIGFQAGLEKVEVDIRPDDIDRIRQASAEQAEFAGKLRARGGEFGEPVGPHAYGDKRSFSREARDLIVGRDASNTAMPAREELARGWALFNNARNAKPDRSGSVDQFLVFGRTPDVNHTGAAPLGFTSEYNNGPVLMPERWNYFMNTCWLMGGIKAGATFVSGTTFEQRSREDIVRAPTVGKPEDDVRSDMSEVIDKDKPPLHYTMTVSVAEIAAFEMAGYTKVEDPTYGILLVPGKTREAEEARLNMSFTDFQSALLQERVGMAIENITGDDYTGPNIIAFTGQGLDTSPEARGKVKEFVDSITVQSGGLPTSDPTNYLVRKVDFKVDEALVRINAVQGRTGGAASTARYAAWKEILGSAQLASDAAAKTMNASDHTKDLMRVSMSREMGKLSRAVEKDGVDGFALRTHGDFQARAVGLSKVIESEALELTLGLASREKSMKDFIRLTGRDDGTTLGAIGEPLYAKDEADSLFEAFKREIAFQSGAVPGSTSGIDLLAAFKTFAARYSYEYGT